MLNTSKASTLNFFLNAIKKASISDDRKSLLLKISEAIAVEYSKNEVVNLNFICTHNSRRSQLGQVWGFFSAHFYNLNINSFSGGTEVTAFHRNTVKTLQKAGFSFHLEDFSHQNPKYSISFEETSATISGFSKRYNHPINPEPFIAITTCDSANANCPLISNANYRFHLPFTDPKSSDGSDEQNETYLKINEQIASEISFIFSEVKKILS